MGVSVPSLHRESTDSSLSKDDISLYSDTNRKSLLVFDTQEKVLNED